jgi:hypothetical protein
MKRSSSSRLGWIMLVVLAAGCAGTVSDLNAARAGTVPDLNGVAGKVFSVNPDDGSFRFLRQDVKYDPATGEGTAWHTAYWTGDTVFMQSEGRQNLQKTKGTVIAVFTGMDEAAAKAMKEGKLFRANKLVLRPDLTEPTGISADGQRIVGWFTPRSERFSRDGKLKLGSKDILAGVKYGGIRITVEHERSADDFACGVWKATLTGKPELGRLVVESMVLKPLVDPFKVDDPKLPRVLSVGDSIAMNYEKAARTSLKGIANYYRIEDNCWSTHRGVAFMAYWLGDYTSPGLHWDVILFNSGLHDMKQKTLGGKYAVSIKVYKEKLKEEIEIMKKTGATLVFCTTTPVPNNLGSAQYAFRTKGAEKDFNSAAREVLRDYPEIQINDLAGVVNKSGVLDNWRKGRDVHFWKAHEQAVVGKAVGDAVVKALKTRGRNKTQ